jgi:hypothetical protein
MSRPFQNPLLALEGSASQPQAHELYHVSVVGRGILYAGICWEVRGTKSQVTECIICWFAMFSHYDRLINLMEESR